MRDIWRNVENMKEIWVNHRISSYFFIFLHISFIFLLISSYSWDLGKIPNFLLGVPRLWDLEKFRALLLPQTQTASEEEDMKHDLHFFGLANFVKFLKQYHPWTQVRHENLAEIGERTWGEKNDFKYIPSSSTPIFQLYFWYAWNNSQICPRTSVNLKSPTVSTIPHRIPCISYDFFLYIWCKSSRPFYWMNRVDVFPVLWVGHTGYAFRVLHLQDFFS